MTVGAVNLNTLFASKAYQNFGSQPLREAGQKGAISGHNEGASIQPFNPQSFQGAAQPAQAIQGKTENPFASAFNNISAINGELSPNMQGHDKLAKMLDFKA